MTPTLRALNRFGLGARPGEAARIGDDLDAARGWLRAQLDSGAPRIDAPRAATPDALADALRALGAANRGSEQDRQRARQRLIEISAVEARAALAARVASERPFVERLVAFWSNHLCVAAAAKLPVAVLAGSYERDAIRPHVLGRFEELVLASARHPAMLIYLDNFQSIGPASRAAQVGRRGAQRQAAPRGLNENYARELLELHTLGVDGGYTQQDVLELARILTGWTVTGPLPGRAQQRATGPIRFAFEPPLHEPGAKTLLGVRYEEAGVVEGERAIRALCRHAATAQFVATKLVRHFVADEPPADAVAHIAEAWRDTDGDLRAVAGALIDLPRAWADDTRKFRSPQDWLVAVLRALDAPAADATAASTGRGTAPRGATDAARMVEAAAPLLRQLRQPLWSPQSPQGYGDTAQDWADPDALLNRAELARSITRRLRTRVPDPRTLAGVIDIAGDDPLHAMLADADVAAADRVALAIAGPAFQWR